VLIEKIDSPEAPQFVARKLLDALACVEAGTASAINVTASIGIGVGCAGDDAETLMRRADEALYAAKMAGRNTFRVAATG
jgi:GGDEF domain-containing protein